jgi:succinoglycan biosynthesis transport protein ExoP
MSQNGSDFTGPQVMAPPVDAGSRAMVAAAPMPPAMMVPPGFAPRGPELLVGGFNQKWLVNCLRRRWLMALAMGLLVGGAVAGLLMWLFPESSRITSYLEVNAEDAASPFLDDKRPVSPIEITRQAAMHPALLKSQLVLQAALLKDEIAQLDAVQYHKGEELLWLTDELKVNFSAESPVLEIAYEGEEDPADMVKIVDAVVEAYKNKVLNEDRLMQAATREDLGVVLVGVRQSLQKKLEELNSQQKIKGSGSLEFELTKLRSDITMYQQQIIKIDEKLVDLESMKYVALENAKSPAALQQAVQMAVDKDPTVNMYKEQLFQLELQIQAIEASSKNASNAQLNRLRANYSQLQSMMSAADSKIRQAAKEQLEKLPNEYLRQAIVEYNVKSQYFNKQKQDIDAKLKAAELKLTEVSRVDPEMEMLEQEIESQQLLVQNLDQKVEEWRTMKLREEETARRRNQTNEFDKVRVIQPALATEKINFYERWAIAGVGGLAALALTGYGVALLEFGRRRLNGPEDMDEGLGVRVLGVLPSTSLKALGGNSLVATQVAEAIDNVRATIMHDSTSRPRQVVLVTSPATMEGATTVASSLAISLARAGRRTLLVDGDLRSPDLHKLFGLPLEDGLSGVLRSEVDLADAIRPTHNEGLHLLTAGVCDMDAIHALATDQPQAIFEKLRDQFDFIVIDAPPVLGISDALNLGQYVDGAVLTVLRDHSEVRSIYHALEVLRSMGVRVIGTVVNGVPTKTDRRVVRLHQASAQRTPRLPAKSVGE